MTKIAGSRSVSALTAADEGAVTQFEGPEISAGTTQALEKAEPANAGTSDATSDKEKSIVLTQAVKSVGEKAKEEETKKRIVEASEGKNPKMRSRRKRRAIERTIDETGNELKGKVKVRLAKSGSKVRLTTETGKQVEGRLNEGESSRELTAVDGSKVLLVNRKLKARQLVKEVSEFVTGSFEKAAKRNNVELSSDALTRLFDFFRDTLIELLPLVVARDYAVNSVDTSPEEQRQIERQSQKRQTATVDSSERIEFDRLAQETF